MSILNLIPQFNASMSCPFLMIICVIIYILYVWAFIHNILIGDYMVVSHVE